MRKWTRGRKMVWIALGLAAAATILVLLVSGSLPKTRKENGIPQLSFSVGDRLGGYPVTNHEGREVDIGDVANHETLLIFGMAGCGDCIADFPSYGLIYALYNSDKLSVVFIWDDEIPSKEMEDRGIPPSACYTAKGRYKFTDWVPSYYLTDADGIIIRQTAEIEEAADSLEDYPVNPEGFEALFQGKKLLVGIERCKSCKGAYDRLLDQGDPFVYVLEGAKEADGAFQMADPHRILTRAFQIGSYPVFLYPDGDGAITVDPNCE